MVKEAEIATRNLQNLTLGSVIDVNGKSSIDVNEFKKILNLTPTSVMPIKIVRISAHSLRWTWRIGGTTHRKPDKACKMRGWTKKIYNWGKATIVLNPITLEIWTDSRPHKNVLKMIYSNWNKADKAAREFSLFAQIALRQDTSHHPTDLQTAHLVLEDRLFSSLLKPYKDREDSRKVGLIFDKSHPNKAEFTGKESAEGAIGLDWWLLEFPKEHRAQMQAQSVYNSNIKLHLAVLQKMSDTLDKIGGNYEKKAD
jgi:hypothetical protein